MSFGEKMRQRRKELGLSMAELAQRTKRCRQTLYRYETGYIPNVPLDVVVLLARALDTTPNWLLGWDDEPRKAQPAHRVRVQRLHYHTSEKEERK